MGKDLFHQRCLVGQAEIEYIILSEVYNPTDKEYLYTLKQICNVDHCHLFVVKVVCRK